MNKAELLADLGAKVVRVLKTSEKADQVKNDAGVRVYQTEVLELNKAVVTGRTITWYTIDEGSESEQAYYQTSVAIPTGDYMQAAAYLSTLGAVKFKASEIDADLGYVIADVWNDNGDGTITKKQVMVYRDGEGMPTHKDIV